MPLQGEEVARQRVGGDEWVVRFASLAVLDRVWEFTAYKAGEDRSDGENLFWSPRAPGFVGSREDVPAHVLTSVEAWIRRTVRATKPATPSAARSKSSSSTV